MSTAAHLEPTWSGGSALEAVRSARAALADGAPARLWALSEPEVTEAMCLLGELASSVSALMVGVLAEARTRSLGAGEGWGPVDWARACAPLVPLRTLTDAEVVAGAADELRLAEVVAAVLEGAQPGPTGSSDAPVSDALPVGKAAQIVRFHKGVRGLADPDDLEAATATLLDAARGAGGLGEQDLAAAVRHAGLVIRPDRLVEDDEQVKRAHRSLVKSKGPLGLSRYTLLLEDEGAAIVDAAVDALAKPRPDEDTGERDPRPPAARRADALLDLVLRAVGAPEGVPRQAKSMLVLTIGLETLEGRCRGAGLTSFGEVLTADTVRRLACDAQVVPVVLGTRGEVLDQGEAIRLFNRAQLRHLWMRDRHCTFAGCRKPAAWTDAHHLLHWTHGGPTDIWNAALLCRAHHTVVHNHRYAGRVTVGASGPFVEWDLTAGSYDVMLAAHRSRAAGDRLDAATFREWVGQSWPFGSPNGGDGWQGRAGGNGGSFGPPRDGAAVGALGAAPLSCDGWAGRPAGRSQCRPGDTDASHPPRP